MQRWIKIKYLLNYKHLKFQKCQGFRAFGVLLRKASNGGRAVRRTGCLQAGQQCCCRMQETACGPGQAGYLQMERLERQGMWAQTGQQVHLQKQSEMIHRRGSVLRHHQNVESLEHEIERRDSKVGSFQHGQLDLHPTVRFFA